ALVAAIVLIATKTTWFQSIWRAMSAGVVAGVLWIRDAALAVFNWVRANWPWLAGALAGPFGLAVVAIIKYWSPIVGFFSRIVHAIGGVFSQVIGYITAPFTTAFNIVKGVVEAAVGVIKGLIDGMMSGVKWGIDTAKSVYNTFARVWNAIEVK